MSPSLDIRRLSYADLPQVIAVERRVFPTPWSLAMFVLELSKPSGICLAAVRDDRLVGYLVCSRYDTVWHLMNVAVDLHARREGIGSTLISELFRRGDGPGSATRSRSGCPTAEPSPSTRGSASAKRGNGAATTTTTARTP
ncbi:MAG: GNAT family N-acetyltransferase [Thermoleophilaceae bacterium]